MGLFSKHKEELVSHKYMPAEFVDSYEKAHYEAGKFARSRYKMKVEECMVPANLFKDLVSEKEYVNACVVRNAPGEIVCVYGYPKIEKSISQTISDNLGHYLLYAFVLLCMLFILWPIMKYILVGIPLLFFLNIDVFGEPTFGGPSLDFFSILGFIIVEFFTWGFFIIMLVYFIVYWGNKNK